MVRFPDFLMPNDTVAICSSARKISFEEVEPSVRLFESRGYNVILGKTIGASCNQFAGDDAFRAEDLQSLINNKEVKAVFFARGGYGSVRILDKLDLSPLNAAPKWFIGYSDVTALLLHIYYNVSLASLHAIMPVNIVSGSENTPCVTAMLDTLAGKPLSFTCESAFSSDDAEVEGEIIGGNLSVICSLLGSNSFCETENKILFIEDLDEYLYHVDRMMQALKRAGKLRGLRALVVGSMNEMHDNAIPFGSSAYEIIASAVAEYPYPKFFGLEIGHETGKNYPVIIGGEVKISRKNGKITLWQNRKAQNR